MTSKHKNGISIIHAIYIYNYNIYVYIQTLDILSNDLFVQYVSSMFCFTVSCVSEWFYSCSTVVEQL